MENSQTAIDCIKYLRESRLGICSFIPLDNNVPNTSYESTKAIIEGLNSQLHSNSYHMCVDMIICDEKYRNAVRFAVGSTVICDTLDNARKLCFDKNIKVKAVTMTGHVISKSGAMTGGSIGNSGNGELSNKFEEKEVEKLKSKKLQLENDLITLKKEFPSRSLFNDLDTNIKALTSENHYCEKDLQVSQEKVNQLNQQSDLKRHALDELMNEKQVILANIKTLDTNIHKIQLKMTQIENDIFKDFSISIGITNICEFESNKLRKHEELTKRKQ